MADALSRAIQNKPVIGTEMAREAARLEFNAGRYALALGLIEEVALGDSLLEASIRFAANAIQSSVELTLAPLEGSVNSAAFEYYPALYATGDCTIFTRQIGGDVSHDGPRGLSRQCLRRMVHGMLSVHWSKSIPPGTKGRRPFAAMGGSSFLPPATASMIRKAHG